MPQPVRAPHTLTAQDRRLLIALQEGLPLAPRPFAVLGDAAGIAETEVREQIRKWAAAGLIRRLGVIVRHRELGYRANAMVVWDVPLRRGRSGSIWRNKPGLPCVTGALGRDRAGTTTSTA